MVFVDINECEDVNVCTDPYSYCRNTGGSYECLCTEGFNATGILTTTCVGKFTCDND